MSILYILAAALGIGLLIFIHELGHFIAARQIGARVEVFSLGFGPRVWGFRRGPTDYRLSLVPVGGYVQVAGQDPGDDRYPADQCLSTKSIGARLWFYSGGVIMNLLFALVAFPIVFASGVEFTAPKAGIVAPGGAAWNAGVRPGDRIAELQGKEMYSFTNMEVEGALAGDSVLMKVERGNESFTVEAHPQYNESRGLRSLGVAKSLTQEYHPITVDPDGPAERAGLRTGDRLISIAGVDAFGNRLQRALEEVPSSLALDVEPGPVVVVVARGDRTIGAELHPGRDGVGSASHRRASRPTGNRRDARRPPARVGTRPWRPSDRARRSPVFWVRHRRVARARHGSRNHGHPAPRHGPSGNAPRRGTMAGVHWTQPRAGHRGGRHPRATPARFPRRCRRHRPWHLDTRRERQCRSQLLDVRR